MRSNVVVKELSINVASADQSYMPQRVVVSGGRDEMNMRELNDVRIPRYIHILYSCPLFTLSHPFYPISSSFARVIVELMKFFVFLAMSLGMLCCWKM